VRIEHVVDIRVIQQLLERLVGAAIRDGESRAVLENEKTAVVARNRFGIGARKVLEVVPDGGRRRAVAVLRAGCVGAKHTRYDRNEACNETFSTHGHRVSCVMAGLVPAIHVFMGAGALKRECRDKPGHDG
jgi:hypothetical protein